MRGFRKVLMKPAGRWIKGCRSGGPASSTAAVTSGSSLNQLVGTQAAEPAPSITSSKLSGTLASRAAQARLTAVIT